MASTDHSTDQHQDDIRLSLRRLALSTWEDHVQDVTDSHRWLEGFLESVQLAHTQAASQGIKPAMSELMKTPGRKRLAGGVMSQQRQNLAASDHHHSTSSNMVKDPVATLLFPTSTATTSRFLQPNFGNLDKENGSAGDRSPNSNYSPRGPFSPATSRIAQSAKSPLRTASPRPALSKANTSFKTLSAISAMSPPTSASKIAPVDIPMEVDSPARRPARSTTTASSGKSKPTPTPVSKPAKKSYAMDDEDDVMFDALAASEALNEEDDDQEERAAPSRVEEDDEDHTGQLDAGAAAAELSMIGEEEEEEANISVATVIGKDVTQQASFVISDTQASASVLSATGQSSKSRVVSGASSVAEEADADTAVPLNDNPSVLRNPAATPSSQALSVSTNGTRTPGGSNTSSFAYTAGSYSAAKVGLGSSPPPASNAGRKSTGGKGPSKPLKFVSIPKKSIGLGLVRNWASSSTSESQSTAASSQSSSIGQVMASSVTTTSTGATKRKSLNGEEGAPSSKRTDQDMTMNHDETNAGGVGTLMSRMREMQSSRQSTIAGSMTSLLSASSRLSGINGPASIPFKPVSSSSVASATIPPAAPVVTSVMPSTSASASGIAVPALVDSAPMVPESTELEASSTTAGMRRPSVMDRVKSFERTASPVASGSRLPLSPSRIGRPMSPVTRSATSNAASPPQSPRMVLSPTFGSSFAKFAAPTPAPTATAGPLRSPRIAAAAAKLASPPPSSPVKTIATRSSPVVPNKSPARVAALAHQKLQQQVSTTPKQSPTGSKSKMSTTQTLMREVQNAENQSSPRPKLVATVSPRVQDTDEEMLDQDEDDRMLSELPPRLDEDEHDADDESDEDGRIRTVVEKDRGGLAEAMDTEGGALKKSQSKMTIPGGFGGDEDENDEDEYDRSVEFTQPTRFKPTAPSGSSIRQPTLHKKMSQSSLASSHSSQAQSRPGSSLMNPKAANSASSHIKSVQAAERARQKQQEEADRKNAQRLEVQQKRAELAQRKKAEEDRAKREEMEKRRKEREEREKKLKQQRPDIKKPQQLKPAGTAACSSSSVYGPGAPLNTSQPGRSNPNGLSTSQPNRQMPNNGPSQTIFKSTTTASSMVGVKFMANSNLGASTSSAPSNAPRSVAPPQFANKPGFAPAKSPAPPVEVYQELPEIDSEYSDSGDEEGRAVKAAALPDWAQSPALAAALYAQQQVNPSDIFGPIPPLQMSEIFKNANLTRLTKRTSSACWEGTDALTQDDLRRYDRAMGFTRQSVAEYKE